MGLVIDRIAGNSVAIEFGKLVKMSIFYIGIFLFGGTVTDPIVLHARDLPTR